MFQPLQSLTKRIFYNIVDDYIFKRIIIMKKKKKKNFYKKKKYKKKKKKKKIYKFINF